MARWPASTVSKCGSAPPDVGVRIWSARTLTAGQLRVRPQLVGGFPQAGFDLVEVGQCGAAHGSLKVCSDSRPSCAARLYDAERVSSVSGELERLADAFIVRSSSCSQSGIIHASGCSTFFLEMHRRRPCPLAVKYVQVEPVSGEIGHVAPRSAHETTGTSYAHEAPELGLAASFLFDDQSEVTLFTAQLHSYVLVPAG